MIKKICKLFILLAVVLIANGAKAFELSKNEKMPVEGDIVLGPGKVEFILLPGESSTKDLKITNRTGLRVSIKIEVEDFTGDDKNSVKLMGDDKLKNSLRNYLKIEKDSFILNHGEKAILPVRVDMPKDAEPGGYYSAVIVRSEPVVDDGKNEGANVDGGKGQISIVSRLASLFFVKVSGDVSESGVLESFKTGKNFYTNGGVDFSIVFKNTGSVHLNPYGNIEISNIIGKKIDHIDMDPWFVMPGFSRERIVYWDKGLGFGLYKAVLTINNGYGDSFGKSSCMFWILPTKLLLSFLTAVLFISIVLWWFFSKFELRKKK